jgi:TorA maturation chaperone TorD
MQDRNINVSELALLSRLFAYPDEPPAAEDLAKIGATWGDVRDNGEFKALQAEYVRLFINALPEVSCPPYGSVYLEGGLMGESTVRLRNLYARYGWQTDELADHIAVELEFLALLATLGEDLAIREDYQFVWDHLHLWAPAFLARVEENDRSGFYRAASRYARKILGLSLDA